MFQRLFLMTSALMALAATPALASQPLETETALLPGKGHGNFQVIYEYISTPTDRETGVPIAFEYSITDRLKFGVEPVVYTSVKPKDRKLKSGTGFGDTEATLTYLLAPQTDSHPAFAIAGEVKFATSSNPLVGTGSTDYRITGIVSKQYDNVTLHANLGYTFAGKGSGGVKQSNIIDFAAAAEYAVNPSWTLVSEVLASTTAGGKDSSAPGAPETNASTILGYAGAVYHPSENHDISFGVSYDSDNTFAVKTGITFKF